MQTNTITGSLLIHYEMRGEQEKALLCAIGQIHRQFGLTSAAKIESIMAAKPRHAPSGHATTLVDAFVGMVIEKGWSARQWRWLTHCFDTVLTVDPVGLPLAAHWGINAKSLALQCRIRKDASIPLKPLANATIKMDRRIRESL